MYVWEYIYIHIFYSIYIYIIIEEPVPPVLGMILALVWSTRRSSGRPEGARALPGTCSGRVWSTRRPSGRPEGARNFPGTCKEGLVDQKSLWSTRRCQDGSWHLQEKVLVDQRTFWSTRKCVVAFFVFLICFCCFVGSVRSNGWSGFVFEWRVGIRPGGLGFAYL